MELILISDTKLKIMLDESDMEKYSISGEESSASYGKAIRSILDSARDQIGFNTEGDEIFVQLYTSKQGGCELFVTKCNSYSEGDGESVPPPKSQNGKGGEGRSDHKSRYDKRSVLEYSASLQNLPAPREHKGARIAYSFPSASELIKVCKALRKAKNCAESRAFCDGGGRFYLLLINAGVSAYSRLDSLSFISEFGKRENPDCIISYISEHGKTVCEEKAIEILSEL